MNKLPIVAAIPNYNMAPLLDRLLGQLSTMNYDMICVLDDASTDTSRLVSKKYPKVIFVSSPTNQGSSAARNQIINELTQPCIIHFLDADVIVQSDPTAGIRRHTFTDQTGFVGGLVLTESGTQDVWNYGPRLGFIPTLITGLYSLATNLQGTKIGQNILKLFKNRPIAGQGKNNIHPYWVIESNFFIYSETFKQFGGFDPRLREHDIQPLAYKLSEAGHVNDFSKEVCVIRSDTLQVRQYNRLFELVKAEGYIVNKYIGVWRWLTSFK